MRVFFEKTVALFFILCIVFIPLNFDGKGFQFEITQFLFHEFIQFFQNNFFDNALKTIDFSSDTIALNLLILVLLTISILTIAILRLIKFDFAKFIFISRKIIVYYLAYILFKYGFNKIVKAQFYLPEPNILYSQVGDLSKDILYWSTMGTSRFYSISLGIIEVLVAFLLLFHRTRIVGLLLAIGVFMNVILVNFGFDISVKTYSILLFLMTLFGLFPELKILFDFFVRRKQVQLINPNLNLIENNSLKISLKFFIISLMISSIILPFAVKNNFNDDNLSRPFLHGVYEVVFSNQKKSEFQIKRFFIHRKKYLILENQYGKRIDYSFELDKSNKKIRIIDYQSNYKTINFQHYKKDSVLKLDFGSFKIIAKSQNWRKTKVLQNDFHWTIDAID